MSGKRSRRAVLASLLGAFLIHAGAPPASANDARAEAGLQRRTTDPAEWLRRAQRDLASGEGKRARESLARVAREHALVADYADLLAARSLLDEGDIEAAQSFVEASRERHTNSPLAADFLRLAGDTRAQQGDEVGARRAWLTLLRRRDRSRSQEAELWAEVARSHSRDENLSLTRQAYMEIWTRFPTEEASEWEAAAWLEAHEAQGVPTPSAGDWRKRADELFRARDLEAAITAYDRALELGLPENQQRKARRRRTNALFKLRRYTEAERNYAGFGGGGDAAIERARSLARSGRVPEAIERLLELGEANTTRRKIANRAKYTAALLLAGEGRSEQARGLFEGLSSDARAGAHRRAALWHLAWEDYLAGRHREAAERFEGLVEIEGDSILALRPRYWRARSLEHLGDPLAKREFLAIATEFPLSYYGWRAARRHPGIATPAVKTPLQTVESRLDPTHLERIRILLEADLSAAARAELRRSLSRAVSLDDRLEVAALYRATDDYNLAQASVIRGNSATLARGPRRHAEEAWWHAWPRAFAREVEAAVEREGRVVSPNLVFAIMREESSYRPKAISTVGARGLMQIMEPTGQELARERGRGPIEADDLFDPALNIPLGTQYLAELASLFPGHRAASIASYNAGPHVVAQWPGLDDLEEDEWVETIPYDPTRQYVKRVLRSRHVYGSLYGDDPRPRSQRALARGARRHDLRRRGAR